MTTLASLNGRDGVITAELDWFFNDSQSELGLRSNFPAMVAKMKLGRGRGFEAPISYDLDGRLVNIATRIRVIGQRLRSIGHHADVLRAWFRPPPPGLKDFGELAGIVVVAARQVGFGGDDQRTAASMLVDLCREKPALRQRILQDAERMRRAACRAYALARRPRKAPPVAPPPQEGISPDSKARTP